MNPNPTASPTGDVEQRLRAFYADFEAGRAEAVLAQLHPEARFSDCIFGELDAPQTRAMIRMLCQSRSADRRFVVHRVTPTGEGATVSWTAHYQFGGRPVVNAITTPVTFAADGRILSYRDEFDLNQWMRMALGPLGLLLGWTPWLRAKVRTAVQQRLAKFAQPAGE